MLARLVTDCEAGPSTTWLIQTYNLGKGTVLSLLEEQGVKMRGPGMSAGRLEEAVELYQQVQSRLRISEQLDCSAETLRQALMAVGVQKRQVSAGGGVIWPIARAGPRAIAAVVILDWPCPLSWPTLTA